MSQNSPTTNLGAFPCASNESLHSKTHLSSEMHPCDVPDQAATTISSIPSLARQQTLVLGDDAQKFCANSPLTNHNASTTPISARVTRRSWRQSSTASVASSKTSASSINPFVTIGAIVRNSLNWFSSSSIPSVSEQGNPSIQLSQEQILAFGADDITFDDSEALTKRPARFEADMSSYSTSVRRRGNNGSARLPVAAATTLDDSNIVEQSLFHISQSSSDTVQRTASKIAVDDAHHVLKRYESRSLLSGEGVYPISHETVDMAYNRSSVVVDHHQICGKDNDIVLVDNNNTHSASIHRHKPVQLVDLGGVLSSYSTHPIEPTASNWNEPCLCADGSVKVPWERVDDARVAFGLVPIPLTPLMVPITNNDNLTTTSDLELNMQDTLTAPLTAPLGEDDNDVAAAADDDDDNDDDTDAADDDNDAAVDANNDFNITSLSSHVPWKTFQTDAEYSRYEKIFQAVDKSPRTPSGRRYLADASITLRQFATMQLINQSLTRPSPSVMTTKDGDEDNVDPTDDGPHNSTRKQLQIRDASTYNTDNLPRRGGGVFGAARSNGSKLNDNRTLCQSSSFVIAENRPIERAKQAFHLLSIKRANVCKINPNNPYVAKVMARFHRAALSFASLPHSIRIIDDELMTNDTHLVGNEDIPKRIGHGANYPNFLVFRPKVNTLRAANTSTLRLMSRIKASWPKTERKRIRKIVRQSRASKWLNSGRSRKRKAQQVKVKSQKLTRKQKRTMLAEILPEFCELNSMLKSDDQLSHK